MRLLLILSLITVPAVASAQPPCPDKLLDAADLNHDCSISKEELSSVLQRRLPSALADLGLAPILPESIEGITNRVLNILGPSATRGDTVTAEDVPKLRSVKLYDRLDLTVGDLVIARGPRTLMAPSAGEKVLALFHARLSALDDQSFAKPARISYTSFDRTDQTRTGTTPLSQWRLHGALILAAPIDLAGRNLDKPLSLTPIAAYDVQIDGDNRATDAITHRFGTVGSLRGGKGISGHVFQITIDEQTDRKYEAAAWGYSWYYSPNARAVGIGRYKQLAPGFIVRWRPFFGGVFSKVHSAAGVTSLNSRPDYDNLFLKVAGDARIRERLIFAPTVVRWKQLEGSKDSHWNSDWSGRFVIAMTPDGQERVSLDAGYGRGEDSPLFRHRGRFDLGIGIKF
jgi:hypothetical protein